MKGQVENFVSGMNLNIKVDWSLRRKFWRMRRDHWGAEKPYLIKEDHLVQNRDLILANTIASYSGQFIVAF